MGTSATDGQRANVPGAAAGRPRRREAFTLLEVILALAVLLMLSGAVVVSFSGWYDRSHFDEGVRRMETALRMARADAALCARRLRLEVDPESGTCRVLWEADPLAKPGEFVPYLSGTWEHDLPTGLAVIARCELVGPSAYQTLTYGSGRDEQAESGFQPVTFYPDGSSDSAEIELQAVREDDPRRALVELDGLSGTITRRTFTEAEYDEYVEGRAGT